MKFQVTPTFERDWKRLPNEHRDHFKGVVPAFNEACDGFARDPGGFQWPDALRVSRIKSAPGIWEMTWSFSGPDGRATFEFRKFDDGELVVLWRRIGHHQIYRRP